MAAVPNVKSYKNYDEFICKTLSLNVDAFVCHKMWVNKTDLLEIYI